MVDWPIIHLLNSTEAQRRDAEWLEHSRQIYRSAKAKRAEVIEALLSVEGLLDEVLLDLLVGRDATSRDRLRELVLAAEFCGTHQKWKMLRSLMESAAQYFEPLGAAVGGELRRDIKDLNDHRNRFAHGDLFVDARDNSVLLRYSEGGTKYMRVDEAMVASLLERAGKARERLWLLHDGFGTSIQTAVLSV